MEQLYYKTLLYDYFGDFLTEKQKRVFELHNHEDMSLSEISDVMGISPQAVSDMLRRVEKLLNNYEKKTGLVSIMGRIINDLSDVKSRLKVISEKRLKCETGEINDIVNIVDNLLNDL